ncbi:MAG: ABC transporter substrate-binding protein [Kiritimatiellaeota bacterium]|nr:ABC transporter substrate-binding protein [Kiritimatiellota bacterium]
MPTHRSPRSRLRRRDAALILALCLPLSVWTTWKLFGFGRDPLVVWSCGGNYEFLKEYVRAFEKQQGCRVRYTAAPVQYLIEEAAYGDREPDVIVGRAGPGWVALRQSGKLARGPVFFALDPFGIAVAKGNPLGIDSIEDLGKKGLRVVQSPGAMRPKGTVPALLMAQVDRKFFPGLVERWENNVTVRPKCGRHLLRPIIDGVADCTLTQRSALFYPDVRGRLDFVSLPPEILLALKKGRASIPQCAGVLRSARARGRADLARRFVEQLRRSKVLLEQFGYLPLDNPRAKELAGLLKVSGPSDMPGRQIQLAMRLEEFGLWREARRRYLKVIYAFGPNHYTARALYRAAVISLRFRARAAARFDLERVVNEYPPPSPNEYDSRILTCDGPIPGVERLPYAHWIRAARLELQGLRRPRGRRRPTPALRRDPRVGALFPVIVTEGDPPKNGRRELGLGLHLLVTGDPEFAARDLLKVCTLNFPSRWMPEAEYLLGLCARERRLPALARKQWERVVRNWPGSRAATAAQLATAAQPRTTGDPAPTSTGSGKPAMPPWSGRYDTHVRRALTYACRLFEHEMPLFAFKEYAKVLGGVYGRATVEDRAEARFRAGVACTALGNSNAAVRQWRIGAARYPDTEWGAMARSRLAALSVRPPDSAIGLPPLPPPAQGTPEIRFCVAEEFRLAGIYDKDEILLEYLKVLTVARPPPGKGARMLAAAEFHLGTALNRTGRRRRALELWRHCLEAFPQTPWAAKAKAALAGTRSSGPPRDPPDRAKD